MADKITWKVMHDLAKKIDDLATSLSIPSYQKLTEIVGSGGSANPFPCHAVVDVDFCYNFELEAAGDGSAPKVLSQSVTSDGHTALVVDEPIKSLIGQNEQFLVTKQTPCWCKTLFKAKRNSDSDTSTDFRLVAPGDSDPKIGCCQKIDVPQDESFLDNGQNFIPSGWASYYNTIIREGAEQGKITRVCPRCIEDMESDSVTFEFDEGDPGVYKLGRVWRKISGSWTWAIRKGWMDTMADALGGIAANSWGALAGSAIIPVLKSDTTIREACAVSREDLLYTFGRNNPSLTGIPGSICTFTSSSTLNDYGLPFLTWCRPWYDTCSSEEQCAGTPGNLFYKETMDQLNSFVDFMGSKLRAVTGTHNIPDDGNLSSFFISYAVTGPVFFDQCTNCGDDDHSGEPALCNDLGYCTAERISRTVWSNTCHGSIPNEVSIYLDAGCFESDPDNGVVFTFNGIANPDVGTVVGGTLPAPGTVDSAGFICEPIGDCPGGCCCTPTGTGTITVS